MSAQEIVASPGYSTIAGCAGRGSTALRDQPGNMHYGLSMELLSVTWTTRLANIGREATEIRARPH